MKPTRAGKKRFKLSDYNEVRGLDEPLEGGHAQSTVTAFESPSGDADQGTTISAAMLKKMLEKIHDEPQNVIIPLNELEELAEIIGKYEQQRTERLMPLVELRAQFLFTIDYEDLRASVKAMDDMLDAAILARDIRISELERDMKSLAVAWGENIKLERELKAAINTISHLKNPEKFTVVDGEIALLRTENASLHRRLKDQADTIMQVQQAVSGRNHD